VGHVLQGYVLIEYPTLDEAKAAIQDADGKELLEQRIGVDYAFVRPPPTKGAPPKGQRKGGRERSASPGARRRKDEDDED
jgi:RNA-binding protein 8A